MSIEEESGSSDLMEMQGISGIESTANPSTILGGEDKKDDLKSKGDEADIDDEDGEADPENENPDRIWSLTRIPSKRKSREIVLSGIILPIIDKNIDINIHEIYSDIKAYV